MRRPAGRIPFPGMERRITSKCAVVASIAPALPKRCLARIGAEVLLPDSSCVFVPEARLHTLRAREACGSA